LEEPSGYAKVHQRNRGNVVVLRGKKPGTANRHKVKGGRNWKPGRLKMGGTGAGWELYKGKATE